MKVDDELLSSVFTISPGNAVSYSLLIDLERIGTQIKWDGTESKYITEEVPDSNYAEYLDGFLIDDNLIATTEHPDLLNYGYFSIIPFIFVGTQDHLLNIVTMNGTNWAVTETAKDRNGDSGIIEIISFGTLMPVPVPGAIWLLGSGLLGLLGIRRRK
ncbi:MAG: PEP-CTERM sorting domain-containing protein [Desulfobacteraceae bacterium]|nr:PEP-CTERM sorting domain-containing protein [Desulfobacteraceae bacterium]